MKMKWKRWTALAMTLCMLLSVVPVSAGAVTASDDTKTVMQRKAYMAGNTAVGAVTVVDARKDAAAVTAKIDCPNAVRGVSVVAAVQAVDAQGNALNGHGMRYLLGTESEGKLSLNIQEAEARYFAVMPVQGSLEQGSISSLVTTCKQVDDGYEMSCSAALTMSDDLAMMAAIAQGNEALKKMRMTCYLESNLLVAVTNADTSKVKFSDPKGIYTLVSAESTDEGLKITYRISDNALKRWASMAAEDIKAELQSQVTMECKETVSADLIKQCSNQAGKIYTYGRVEITYGNGGGYIPGLEATKVVVPAALAEMTTGVSGPGEIPEIPVPGSGIADPNTTGVAARLNTVDHTAFMQGDSTGTFRPNANVTRAEVAMIFYRLLKDQNVPITVSFRDVPSNAWYAQAVNTLASLGIVNGIGDGTFAPTRAIKRCEFAAICSRFAKAASNGTGFTDVPASHWAYNNINTCAAYGWINGVGDGTFRPDRSITRAETATMVNRMLGRLGDQAAIDAGLGRKFPDVTKAHWAWYQIGEATSTHNYHMNSDRTQETWN